MKKNGINVYNKKDSVLNTPGQFFFQIRDDGEYKTNNVHISRKIFDEIKNKIIAAFKTISQNLKLMLNRFTAGTENDKIKYYTEITNKLDKFVDLSNHRGFGFPGLQVISLTSKQSDIFAQLKERVLICEKSDGVRYLLIHFANGKCVMLGRSLEFFLVEFTTKLPVVKANNSNHDQNSGFARNPGHTSTDWEIISILDGELILDEVEHVIKIKREFKAKTEENAGRRFLPQRQSSTSDLIFGSLGEENLNTDNFNNNNDNENLNNFNDLNEESLFDIEHERKLVEAKENEYLRGLTVQQKSTMVYINDDLFQVKFVVFDAIILDNVNIGSLPFHKRLDNLAFYFKTLSWPKIHENIRNNFLKTYLNKIEPALVGFREQLMDSANNPFKSKYNQSASGANANSDLNLKFKIDLYMKDYFTFDKIKFLYEKVCGKLLHENDGIILNLDDYPYYSGQATEIYKWKPQYLNTVDFEVEPKRFHRRSAYNKAVDEKENFEEVFLLKVSEGRDKDKVINMLLFADKAEEDRFIQELRSLKSTNSKAVIECHFEKNKKVVQDNFHKYEVLKRNEFEYIQDMHDHTTQYGQSYKVGYWKFMRFRKDKLYGNSLQTFYKVWESIEDDLTIDKMQEKLDFYKKNPDIVKVTLEKTKNIPFSIILSKAQQQYNQNNLANPFNIRTSGQNSINLNNPFSQGEYSNNELNLLNRKRAVNGSNDGNVNNHNHHNIFGVQNNVNFINSERDREEKQMKLKAKKEEKKNKELTAIQTKKTNTKESLDIALGIANSKTTNGNKANLNLNENANLYNKKNSIEDNDLSDLSSEE